jgi:hypothetical protein
MNYDDEGRFLGFEEFEDIGILIELKNKLLDLNTDK